MDIPRTLLRNLLKTGYAIAQDSDNRFAIAKILARILSRPNISEALYAEIARLLDGGTPEELRYFVAVGQYQFRDEEAGPPVGGPA
ncbi:hypothetical protein [Streptomyces sp. NPDC089795]|uniref:hypothetical protein n=1 Tax=Streptomyces sp. NPDC089795 TaxID=3155297 RepID=UPI00344A1573